MGGGHRGHRRAITVERARRLQVGAEETLRLEQLARRGDQLAEQHERGERLRVLVAKKLDAGQPCAASSRSGLATSRSPELRAMTESSRDGAR